MSADESQGDDELDGDDLKPHFESPPWLGPLEAFDLGGGGSINPSINRYLREFQREGVRKSRRGKYFRARLEFAYMSAVSDQRFRRTVFHCFVTAALCCAVLRCSALASTRCTRCALAVDIISCLCFGS